MPVDTEGSSSKRNAKPYQKGGHTKFKKNKPPQKKIQDESKFGVSKLKSLIRQSSRFLQREGVEPGLKIQTERRLESLRADLKRAEQNNVEKKNHEKYHMIRFFERKKLLRIIKRGTSKIEKDEKQEDTVREVFEARVMLNYIIHYPMAEKYIALFAGSAEQKQDDEEERHLALPPHFHITPAEDDQPGRRRLDLLNKLKVIMEDRTTAEKQGISLKPEESVKEEGGKGNKSGIVVDRDQVDSDADADVPKVKQTAGDDDDDFFE